MGLFFILDINFNLRFFEIKIFNDIIFIAISYVLHNKKNLAIMIVLHLHDEIGFKFHLLWIFC